MSKPTQRQRAQQVMELERKSLALTRDINTLRRQQAETRRAIHRLVGGANEK